MDIIMFRILKVSKSQLIFSVLLEIIDYIQLFLGCFLFFFKKNLGFPRVITSKNNIFLVLSS